MKSNPITVTPFDYLIAGAGLSGLMMLYRMCQDPWFADKRIAIVDVHLRRQNDRTWCFWEESAGEWDALLHQQWHDIRFKDTETELRLPLAPYSYKMLRADAFYQRVWDSVAHFQNLSCFESSITKIENTSAGVAVHTGDGVLHAAVLLNSLLDVSVLQKQTQYPYLKQHFVGWFVRTEHPIFDATVADFMDFSIPQLGNTRFMYVLPFSANEALVEYTLFSEDLLKHEVYEEAIQKYLTEKGAGTFDITDTERGNIPMCSYPLWKDNTPQHIRIGSAGGWTKASTGYTFYNTAKISQQLLHHLKKKPQKAFSPATSFWYLDWILLEVLHKRNDLGGQLFGLLFRKIPVTRLLQFLNEETSLGYTLKIMHTMPKLQFIPAVIRAFWRKGLN